MTVSIDQSGCIGCGMCAQTAPEVFALSGGVSQVLCSTVPPHCEEDAKEAAAVCPVAVILIDG